jgi:hypothetical protein
MGKISFNPFDSLTIRDIVIKREKIYVFRIKEAKVALNYLLLFKLQIPSFYLGDTSVTITTPKNSISELGTYVKLKPGLFVIRDVEIFNLALDVKTKELTLQANTSLEIEPITQSLTRLDLKIRDLESQGAALKGVSLNLAKAKEGSLNIQSIQYNKAKISDIKSAVKFDGKTLALDNMSANIFEGTIHGNLVVKLDKEPKYFCRLDAENVDLERIEQDFELKEKFQMSGKIAGGLSCEGSGADFKIIDGQFSSMDPGGTLVVTDDKMLENVAKSSGQSMDILVESFKNYHYNTGIIKLGLEEGNLVLSLDLDGEAGKRNLTIVLHDFKIGKGEL